MLLDDSSRNFVQNTVFGKHVIQVHVWQPQFYGQRTSRFYWFDQLHLDHGIAMIQTSSFAKCSISET